MSDGSPWVAHLVCPILMSLLNGCLQPFPLIQPTDLCFVNINMQTIMDSHTGRDHNLYILVLSPQLVWAKLAHYLYISNNPTHFLFLLLFCTPTSCKYFPTIDKESTIPTLLWPRLDVISYTILFTPLTSLTILLDILSSTSYGILAQFAVMKSVVTTALKATT